jgi:hypothetical protein
MKSPRAAGHTHLGMETQRQWNDRAIARATPALLSLYSIITLTAHLLIEKGATCVRSTAWYRKTRPTFSDAMALVRRHLWNHLHFSMSQQQYFGQSLGCLFGDDTIVTKGFVIRAGFFQTLPIG